MTWCETWYDMQFLLHGQLRQLWPCFQNPIPSMAFELSNQSLWVDLAKRHFRSHFNVGKSIAHSTSLILLLGHFRVHSDRRWLDVCLVFFWCFDWLTWLLNFHRALAKFGFPGQKWTPGCSVANQAIHLCLLLLCSLGRILPLLCCMKRRIPDETKRRRSSMSCGCSVALLERMESYCTTLSIDGQGEIGSFNMLFFNNNFMSL